MQIFKWLLIRFRYHIGWRGYRSVFNPADVRLKTDIKPLFPVGGRDTSPSATV
jgi:hypothetical protein